MPWHTVDNHPQCPTSKPWGVVKNADGHLEGCHPTQAAANKHLAALYANEGTMTNAAVTPTDNIVRSMQGPDVATLGNGRTLYGHFAVYNTWARISSVWEGTFLERIAPTAFDRAMTEQRAQIKVLYDHGKDPQVGNKPLGVLNELRSDKIGAYYEVDLIEASYNNDWLIPAARAGLLGASFRFSIPEGGDTWSDPTRVTDWNPDMLPERTITDADLYEFGPVTFPAYPDATVAVRSRTDDFLDHFLNDPLFVARFKERVGPAVVEQIRAGLPPTVEPGDETLAEAPTEREGDEHTAESADGGESESKERRERWLEGQLAGFHASLARHESRNQ